MPHDPDRDSEHPDNEDKRKPGSILGVIVKVILGLVAVYVIVVALFFGMCLLGS